MQILIRKANKKELEHITRFIDHNFVREGYGFISKSQIETELKRQTIYVAETGLGQIVGTRIGKKRIWNLAVHKAYRGQGIGKMLIDIYDAETIRVKATPVGHLSKEQLKNFSNPEGFYKKVGFSFSHKEYPKNFFSGQKGDKRIYYTKGKTKHIKVHRNNKQQTLF